MVPRYLHPETLGIQRLSIYSSCLIHSNVPGSPMEHNEKDILYYKLKYDHIFSKVSAFYQMIFLSNRDHQHSIHFNSHYNKYTNILYN